MVREALPERVTSEPTPGGEGPRSFGSPQALSQRHRYRCLQGGVTTRCGWNRRELAGGRNWGQGAMLEEMGRGQTHGGPQATLGTHFDFAELGALESWEGGGDPFPEVPCSKDAGEQESVEMSPSSEGGEVFLITIFGLSNLLQ